MSTGAAAAFWRMAGLCGGVHGDKADSPFGTEMPMAGCHLVVLFPSLQFFSGVLGGYVLAT